MPNSVPNVWVAIQFASTNQTIARKFLRPIGQTNTVERLVAAASLALGPGVAAKAQVVVFSDDPELSNVASRLGALVAKTGAANSHTGLEDFAKSASDSLSEFGASDSDVVLFIDANYPLISAETITSALKSVLQFESASAVSPKTAQVALLGGRFGSPGVGQVFAPGSSGQFELPESESAKLETYEDLAVIEHWATRKSILIRCDFEESSGAARAHSALSLANALARHSITIVTSSANAESTEFFGNSGFAVESVDDDLELLALARKLKTELVILTNSANAAEFVTLLGGFCKVATVEEFGEAAAAADLTLNAVFERTDLAAGQLSSMQNSIIPDGFEALPRRQEFSEHVSEILVWIPGFDNLGLTHKILNALDEVELSCVVTVVRGLGSDLIDPNLYKLKLRPLSNVQNLAPLVEQADLVITAADVALAAIVASAVPTVTLAQNNTELQNAFATGKFGVVPLGLGALVSQSTLSAHLGAIIEDVELRRTLHSQAAASASGRSNQKTAANLLRRLGL